MLKHGGCEGYIIKIFYNFHYKKPLSFFIFNMIKKQRKKSLYYKKTKLFFFILIIGNTTKKGAFMKQKWRTELIYEYERVLTGQTRSMESFFFLGSDAQNQETALHIVRYVVEKYLKWTPDEMEAYFDEKIIKQMRLESVIKYIKIPPELSEHSYFYIAHLLYPDKIRYDEDELTIQMYSDILSGKRTKFIKNYMEGPEGHIRACVCLRYVIENYLTEIHGIQELYRYFSSPKIMPWLRKFKLIKPCTDMFMTPVDILHESLSEEQQDNTLFYDNKLAFLLEKKKITPM